jgi:hypothetical protein
MPGAPNRPPEPTPTAPAVAPTPEPAHLPLLRRLVPSQVALLQESWKGPVPADVYVPFARAEEALAAGDVPTASQAVDLLSIRFAEPRWPTLPEPFRLLRVPIPAPMPPSWDPENALPPAERDARRARRAAEGQLTLATACVGWAGAHGLDVTDLSPAVERARSALAAGGVPPEFYREIDLVWERLRSRLPRPKTAGRPAAPVAPAADAEES